MRQRASADDGIPQVLALGLRGFDAGQELFYQLPHADAFGRWLQLHRAEEHTVSDLRLELSFRTHVKRGAGCEGGLDLEFPVLPDEVMKVLATRRLPDLNESGRPQAGNQNITGDDKFSDDSSN